MKKTIIAATALAVLLTVTGAGLAQEPQEETQSLRKEVVRLKYVKAHAISPLLWMFVGRGGNIQSNPALPDILTIRDTPENVAKILAAIKEIDVKPSDVLFTVHLILGSETDGKTDPELQNDPIISELRKLLRYKGYTLLDTTFIRGVDREASELVLGRKADFWLGLRPEVAKGKPQDFIKIGLRLRQTSGVSQDPEMKAGPMSIPPKDLIASHVNLRSGDKTVVGVSKLDGGDKGLILIISAKVVD